MELDEIVAGDVAVTDEGNVVADDGAVLTDVALDDTLFEGVNVTNEGAIIVVVGSLTVKFESREKKEDEGVIFNDGFSCSSTVEIFAEDKRMTCDDRDSPSDVVVAEAV